MVGLLSSGNKKFEKLEHKMRELRVSVSTLFRRVTNPFPVKRPGKPTVFTRFEEDSFRKHICSFESMNLPLGSTKFLQLMRTEASRKSKK